MAQFGQGRADLGERDQAQLRLGRCALQAQADQVAVSGDECADEVIGVRRTDAALQHGPVDIQATFVLGGRTELQFGAADADFGRTDGGVAQGAAGEDLADFGKALLGHQPTQARVAVVGMVHVAAVHAGVPQVRVVQGERQRVAVAPHHGAEGAVAQGKAVVPLVRRFSVDQAMRATEAMLFF